MDMCNKRSVCGITGSNQKLNSNSYKRNLETLLNIPVNDSILYTKLSTTRYTDLESFDCPVCLSMVLPPIRLVCENLHIVCNSCFPQLKLSKQGCPKCRKEIEPYSVRCFEAEYILRGLLTKSGIAQCQFSSYGCTFFRSRRECEQVAEHEPTCAYRLVKMTDDLLSWYDANYTRRLINTW